MGTNGYVPTVGLVVGTLAAAAAYADWSAPETITPPSGEWRTCYNYARSLLADDAGDLHAIFFEDHGGGVCYRRYDRAAGRWEESYPLDEHGGRDATLVIDAYGELHAFFNVAKKMCHRVADDAGRWSAPEYITVPECRCTMPSPLALAGGDVALAMVGEPLAGRPVHIWFTIWHRATREFEPPVRLSENTGESGSWMPTMAYFQDEIRLVWRDDSTGDMELYERKYDGSSWTPARRLTYDPAATFHANLAVDGDGVLRLLFMDTRTGNAAIWEMIDYGGGWGAEHILYDGGRDAFHPNMVRTPAGRLLVCWEDNRATERHEIYYASLVDGVWGEACRVTRTPHTDSALASPAVTAGEVAVAYNQTPGKVCVQRLPQDEVPVRGVTFAARTTAGVVKLGWDGADAEDFEPFDVLRRAPGESGWRRLNDRPITGHRPYAYDDGTAPAGECAYRLVGRTAGGRTQTLGTARVTVGGAADKFISDLNVSPNPCRGAVRLTWRQLAPAAATVVAYDIAGRRVAAASTAGAAGANVLTLETGPLAPGCYVAAFTAGGHDLDTKFVVAR